MTSSSAPALVVSWTQGVRSLDNTGAIAWQDLLFLRLANRYLDIPPHPKTAASESALGVPRSAYWYVGRLEPDYARVACIYVARTDSMAAGVVTPFDTGGLWHDRILTVPPTDGAEKRALVQRTARPSDAYHGPMSAWLGSAYEHVTEYVRGARPSVGAVDRIPIEAPNTSQAWTWEARLPVDYALAAPVQADRVFMTDDDADAYRQWLIDFVLASADDLRMHMEFLAASLVETDQPFSEALARLEAAA